MQSHRDLQDFPTKCRLNKKNCEQNVCKGVFNVLDAQPRTIPQKS